MPSPEPCTNPPCDSMVVPKDTFMVWQIPMLPDFTYGFSATPLIIDDKLIFTNRLVVQGEPINAVNKSTGELLWRNENSLTISSSSVPFYYSGNKLAFLQNYQLSTWNIDTGNKIWGINFREFPNGNSFSNLSGFGNLLFTSTLPYNADKKSTIINLVKIDMDNQQIDTLYSLTTVDGYTPDIEPPGVTINIIGDTLLLFQCRLYNFPKGDGRIDFYCFNMTQKKLEWKNEDIEESGIGAIYTPQILGDKVYYQGSNEVFMFDIATGNKIWSRRFLGESYYFTKNLIVGDKIFVKDDGYRFKALDVNTGNTIWETDPDKKYGGGLGPAYVDGNVFIMGTDSGSYGAIFGLRASTGKQFWQYRTPNYKKYSSSTFGYINMIADPETGYLYTGDGVFMMCLKPPK